MAYKQHPKTDKLTPREKAAGAFLLCGMVLLCCNSIGACAAGLALLGAGALALNRKEGKRVGIRANPRRAERAAAVGMLRKSRYQTGRQAI